MDAHSHNGHDISHNGHAPHPTSFQVRTLRQAGPGQASYWERQEGAYEPEMNVISVLQRIAAKATTVDGHHVAPVAWDCNCLEEVCGACTMNINGRVRQSCSALIDNLINTDKEAGRTDNVGVLEPMKKFPVVRDLFVNRQRMFELLIKSRSWVPIDG